MHYEYNWIFYHPLASYTIYEIIIPSMCNEDFSPHYKGNMKRPFDFSFFFQVHHEYLNSQASVSIELQRLFVFASFSIISTANKREILNKLLWLCLPQENLCALQAWISKTWIFKTRILLISLMQSAQVIMPRCPVVHDKKAFLSSLLSLLPFRNDHSEWRKPIGSNLTLSTCN